MYTREELYEALLNFNNSLIDSYSQMSEIDFNLWFNETYPIKTNSQ